jgi:hypothetical protein
MPRSLPPSADTASIRHSGRARSGPATNYGLIGTAVYLLVLPLFLFLADAAYPFSARALAWLLFVIGSLPALVYLTQGRQHVPVIELIMLAWVSAFSVPVFFETELVLFQRTIFPQTVPVTTCILLAIIAVCALWAGYRIAPPILRHLPLPQLRLHCDPRKLFYYALGLALLSLMRSEQFGPFEQIAELIVSQDLAVALLAILYYKGTLNAVQRLITIAALIGFVLKGVAIGMTQPMLQPLLVWFICRWLVVKKFEWWIVPVAIAAFIVIQPVKLQYREIVWTGGAPLSYVEKIGIFGDLFASHWLTDQNSDKIAESTRNRTSLLLQTSHVIDWTPEVVPYENGQTFLYLVFGWVPRFLWPEKPVAQEVNIKYALNYGVTTDEGVLRTMFGVGELGEAYMNFGGEGLIPIFLLLGVLNYLAVHVISLPPFSVLKEDQLALKYVAPVALLVAILVKLVFIGSSISSLYVGIIQLLLVQAALMYVVTGMRDRPVSRSR